MMVLTLYSFRQAGQPGSDGGAEGGGQLRGPPLQDRDPGGRRPTPEQ